MRQLSIWLKELQIKKFGTVEALNEPYILSMAVQDNLKGEIVTERDDVHEIFPAAFQKFNRYVVTRVTPVFSKVRRGDYLNIVGKGVNLIGPVVLNGPMQLHLAVMESDSDIRNLGKIMEHAFKDSGLTKLLDGVEKLSQLSDARVSLVLNALKTCFGMVLGGLKADKDDLIQSFEFGDDFYQTESPYEDVVPLSTNRYVKGSLLVEWEDER